MFVKIYSVMSLLVFLFMFSIWKSNTDANLFFKSLMLVFTCAAVANASIVFNI